MTLSINETELIFVMRKEIILVEDEIHAISRAVCRHQSGYFAITPCRPTGFFQTVRKSSELSD